MELAPGFTEYGERVQAQTHDVTSLLRDGPNVVAVLLADGWSRGQVGMPRAADQWGETTAVRVQLESLGAHGWETLAPGSWVDHGGTVGLLSAPQRGSIILRYVVRSLRGALDRVSTGAMLWLRLDRLGCATKIPPWEPLRITTSPCASSSRIASRTDARPNPLCWINSGSLGRAVPGSRPSPRIFPRISWASMAAALGSVRSLPTANNADRLVVPRCPLTPLTSAKPRPLFDASPDTARRSSSPLPPLGALFD